MIDTETPVLVPFPDNNMRDVAIEGVSFYAEKAGKNAAHVQRYMRLLADTPIYHREAKEALRLADVTLSATLLIIKLAIQQIENQRE